MELIGLISDMHCPFHEPAVTNAFTAWLAEFKPSRVYILGDAGDWPSLGRHRKNHRKFSTMQECIDSIYDVLVEWRVASPESEITMIPGNHDFWGNRQLQDAGLEEFMDVRPARSPEAEPLNSLVSYLRLDELNINLVSTSGEYHDVELEIVGGLAGLHGVAAGVNGGAISERAGWEGSVVQGHDHRQTLAARILRLPNGTQVRRWAWSLGAASQRDLGYNHKRDIGQGFGSIALHKAGSWHPEMGSLDPANNVVTWRDWIFRG